MFTGRVNETWAVRQAALDRHYADYPERYVNGPPQAARPPSVVAINPDDAVPASKLMATPGGFAAKSTPVSTELAEVVT